MLNRMVGTPARLALPLLILLVAVAPARAQEAAAPQQREHVVRRGDTLWDLARLYLNNPFLWPMIYEANRNVVRDPHWIYPAERLIIPPVLQQPFEQPEPIGRPPTPRPEGEPVPVPAAEPEAEQEPTPPLTVTTVDLRRPVVTAVEYVRLPWLNPTADPGVTGRIVRRVDGVPAERIPSSLYPNDRVQLTLSRPVAVGDSLVAIRVGRRVGNAGTIIEPLALLRVDSVQATGATARIVSQFGETRVGDRIMPLQPMPDVAAGEPEDVPAGPEGRILEFLQPAAMHGTTDVAFISLGRAAGLRIGDELAVYVPATAGMAPTHAGVVRVVRVGDRTATVRVLSVAGTAMREGLPVRLVRRMP